MTQDGITIRFKVEGVSIIGRDAQGVRLVKLGESDKVAAIAGVVKDDEETTEDNPDQSNEKDKPTKDK
jgi:DNA gyrase subunit A